jgi:hypothetical protein
MVSKLFAETVNDISDFVQKHIYIVTHDLNPEPEPSPEQPEQAIEEPGVSDNVSYHEEVSDCADEG